MKKHAGRITVRITVTMGTAGAILFGAQPAWAATTTPADEASLGVDPEAIIHQLQNGAKIAAAVAALVIVGKLLRGQRRRTWGAAQSDLHVDNKLARGALRTMPTMPAAPADEMPNWLVTGSHTATRRAWSGSPTGANPVASMSARSARPLR